MLGWLPYTRRHALSPNVRPSKPADSTSAPLREVVEAMLDPLFVLAAERAADGSIVDFKVAYANSGGERRDGSGATTGGDDR